MSNHPSDPQSLLAVTNWQSRALEPWEAEEPEFKRWAHENDIHLYLVLVGPRTEILGLDKQPTYWKLHTLFHDGTTMKPRMLPVPFEILPEKGPTLTNDGVVAWTDDQGTHELNAIEIARRLLQTADRPLDLWHQSTLEKLFTYQVEYIGQSFGKAGERTPAERIGQGHATVQSVLSRTISHRLNSAVAFVVLDAHVQGVEMTLSLGPDNVQEMSARAARLIAQPEGPLVDRHKLVTVFEALLIRSFPAARNQQYKRFPLKDAPQLVEELLEWGYTHLGVRLDVSQSLALLRHPNPAQRPQSVLRFGVNLRTGEYETLPEGPPISWQAN